MATAAAVPTPAAIVEERAPATVEAAESRWRRVPVYLPPNLIKRLDDSTKRGPNRSRADLIRAVLFAHFCPEEAGALGSASNFGTVATAGGGAGH